MDPQNKRASTKSEGFWIVLCMFFLLENNLLGKTLGCFSLIFLGNGLREATTCIISVINSAASSSTNAKDFELLMSTLLMMDRHFQWFNANTCCLNLHFSSSHPFSHGYGSKPSPSVQFKIYSFFVHGLFVPKCPEYGIWMCFRAYHCIS